MSVFHIKHFLKGKRGHCALRKLYSDMFINTIVYSPMQYRLVLVALAYSCSCSGQISDIKIIDNLRELNKDVVRRISPFVTTEKFEGKWNLH